MTTSQQPLNPLIVNHSRIPHTVIPVVVPHKNDPVCIVALTGGFFRVIHLGSGVTLTDTRTLTAAKSFVRIIRDKYKNNFGFKRKLDDLSLDKLARHNRGIEEKNVAWLLRFLDYYTSAEDHVSNNITNNERYIYPPEPIS